MAEVNEKRPLKILVVPSTFTEYQRLLNHERESWEIDDPFAPSNEAEANGERDAVMYRAVIDDPSNTLDEQTLRATFGRFAPARRWEGYVLLERLKKLEITVGQEVQFSLQGPPEYSAIVSEVEAIRRVGERLQRDEPRIGFRLHLKDGRKI